jgi:hypothetical protein
LQSPQRHGGVNPVPHLPDLRGHCGTLLYREENLLLFNNLSLRNAAFVRHLVLDPTTAYDYPPSLEHCNTLQTLTLFQFGRKGSSLAVNFRANSPMYAVSALTIRFVPDEKYNPRYWSNFDSEPGQIERCMFNFLRYFDRVESLGLILHTRHETVSGEVFGWVSAATKHLRIRIFNSNLVPDETTADYGLALSRFPALEEIRFAGKSPISSFHDATPRASPYRARPFSTHTVPKLIELEEKYKFKFNFRGLEVMLWNSGSLETKSPIHPRNLSRPMVETLDIYHNWLKMAQSPRLLVSCVQVDLFCPATPDFVPLLLGWGYPDIYLDIRCCSPKGFTKAHVDGFVTKLVPSTRSLFVNSFLNPNKIGCNCSPNGIQCRGLFDLFSAVTKRAPHFQLEHLQNFPPLDHEIGPFPLSLPGETYFLDARSFQPLSSLLSLTSLDLDFNYLKGGNSLSVLTIRYIR